MNKAICVSSAHAINLPTIEDTLQTCWLLRSNRILDRLVADSHDEPSAVADLQAVQLAMPLLKPAAEGLIKNAHVFHGANGLYEACAAGNLPLVSWLAEYKTFDSATVCNVAVAAILNHKTDVVKFLFRLFPVDAESVRSGALLLAALHMGNLELAQWITDRVEHSPECVRRKNQAHLRFVCESGSFDKLPIARWFADRFNITRSDVMMCSSPIFSEICNSGRLEFAQWFADRFSLAYEDIWSENDSLLIQVCLDHNVPMVDWLVDRFGFDKADIMADDRDTFRALCLQNADSGNLEMLKYITAKFGITREDANKDGCLSLLNACYNGNIKLVHWLADTFEVTHDEAMTEHGAIFLSVCFSRNIEFVKWFADRFALTTADVHEAFAHVNPRFLWENIPVIIFEWIHTRFGVSMPRL